MTTTTCKKHTDLLDLYSRTMFGSVANLGRHLSAGSESVPVTCFCCPHRTDCLVGAADPIYTGWLGDCESDILVVGEAPSSSKAASSADGKAANLDCDCVGGSEFEQVHLSGYTRNIVAQPKSDLAEFIKFVLGSCLQRMGEHLSPYFTDVVKCGLPKQNANGRKLLKMRAQYCVEHILVHEIEIIEPRIIACAGKTAFATIKALKAAGKVPASTTVIPFIHYSRQAQLPLTTEDKVNSVWPIQAGCVPDVEICGRLKNIESVQDLIHPERP